MTRFMVFEPPSAVREPMTAGATERAVFVRDSFSIWAFLFPPVWLLRYGLFVSAILALLLAGWLAHLARSGLAPVVVPLLLLFGILVALEGPELRARRFLARGFRDAGAVEARDAAEAAILYFAASEPARSTADRAPNKALPWAFEPVAPAKPARRRWWPLGGKA